MPTAAKYLLSLDRKEAQRIVKKVDEYARSVNPFHFAKKLEGYDAYRFKVGRFRVIFDHDSHVISVLVVDKRKDIYRKL